MSAHRLNRQAPAHVSLNELTAAITTRMATRGVSADRRRRLLCPSAQKIIQKALSSRPSRSTSSRSVRNAGGDPVEIQPSFYGYVETVLDALLLVEVRTFQTLVSPKLFAHPFDFL